MEFFDDEHSALFEPLSTALNSPHFSSAGLNPRTGGSIYQNMSSDTANDSGNMPQSTDHNRSLSNSYDHQHLNHGSVHDPRTHQHSHPQPHVRLNSLPDPTNYEHSHTPALSHNHHSLTDLTHLNPMVEAGDHHYSPSISFQTTPLMSPHALVPITGPNGVSFTEIQQFYGAHPPRMRQPSTGKVTKASPATRWQKPTVPPEDEFRLEDPAISFELPGTATLTNQNPPGIPPPVAPTPSVNNGVSASGNAPGSSPGAGNVPGACVLNSASVAQNSAGASPTNLNSNSSSRNPSPQSANITATFPHQDEIEVKLRSAIQATSRAGSTGHLSRRASSVSSQRTTPRIRPKLSNNNAASTEPSPLMRPYDAHEEDVFLKSNYHNLVDGTHHHLGLSSGDQMATELRSKKTVHKLAEQERRNRMNTAISELSSLLKPDMEESKTVASKAATVERATEYIKHLHKRIAELEDLVSALRAEKSVSGPKDHS